MKCLLSGLLFLLSLTAISQANWQPGFLVTTKGDTLRGMIDDRRWSTQPEGISFQAAGGEKQTYSINDVNAVSINDGDYYWVVNLTVDLTPTDLSRLVFSGQESFVAGRYFLHRLYQGPTTSLYEINHSIKSVFLIEDKSGKLTELVYRNLLVGQDRMMQSNNTFRQQLQGFAVRVDDKLIQRLNRLNYSSVDLLSLMPLLNNVTAEGDRSKQSVRGVLALRPFVQAGLLADKVYGKQGPSLGIVPEFDTHLGPSFGGGVELFGKNGLQKFFMRIGVMIEKLKAYDTVKLQTADRIYGTTMNRTRLTMQFNYQRGIGKIRAYGGAGWSYVFAKYQNHQFIGGGERSFFLLQAQIGARYKQFFLQGEFHLPRKFGFEDFRMRSYGLSAGFMF